MGVLDEAIREHLELKRRHGADPGEVAHLERHALDPVGNAQAPPFDEAAPRDRTAQDHRAPSLEHKRAQVFEETFAWDPAELEDEPAGRGEPAADASGSDAAAGERRRAAEATPPETSSPPRPYRQHPAASADEETLPTHAPEGSRHVPSPAPEETIEIEIGEIFGTHDQPRARDDPEEQIDRGVEDDGQEIDAPRSRLARLRHPRRSAGRFPSGR
ncbi:MAG: hypothetical protein ACYCUM_14240 [Solirubrobacteraceae bacterium]